MIESDSGFGGGARLIFCVDVEHRELPLALYGANVGNGLPAAVHHSPISP
jgi:hypothetical protein